MAGRPGALAGRVAIITGAASGIGRACAQRFLAEGAAVLAVDCDREALEAAAAQVTGLEPLALDVTAEGAPEAMVGAAVDRFGALHVLVANAGAHGRGEDAAARFDDAVATNLRAPYLAAHAALPHLRVTTRGSVIFVASIAGAVVGFASPHYDASKAGLVGLTRHLASAWGRHGVRVNAICPGFIETPFIGPGWTEERLNAVRRDIALGRLGRAEEIAGAALFLASDAASYVTGSALVVDGGWTTHFAKYW